MDVNASTSAALSGSDPGPEIAQGHKTHKPRPYYNYTALPKGWIRLIRIHESPTNAKSKSNLDDDVHVTLHDFPLSSCPDYIALSYTWGEPFRTVDPEYRTFTQEPRCFPIDCGGYLLRGTRNLRAALRHLREGQQIRRTADVFNQGLDYVERLQQHFGSSMRVDLYWIDTLCIDQDDLLERSIQVSFMGEIYNKAQLCIVWLGEKDYHVISAMELAVEFSNNRELSDAFQGVLDSDATETVGRVSMFRQMFDNIVMELPEEKAIALAVLLSHAWFSRVWVLQEVALAPKVVVQCGSHFTDFETLMRLGQYINISNNVPSLAMSVTNDIRQKFGFLREGTVGSFAETHLMLSTLSTVKMELHEGTTPAFSDVLALASRCESTDPRDKIYGLLAITNLFQLDSERTLWPDYTLPVEIVYTKATSQTACRQKHLGFLVAVCQKHRKNIKGLPSWCPDYTNLETGLFSMYDVDDRGYAASLWGHQPDIKVIDDKLLVVHGFRHDVVDKFIYGVTGFLGLGMNMSLNDQSRRNGATRIDSLWRLLIRDELENVTPAPKVAGLFFPAMMGLLMNSTKSSPPSEQQAPLNEKLSDWIHIIAELRLLEPESCPFLPDADLMREFFDEENPNYMERASSYMAREVSSIPQRAVEAGLIPELKQLVGFDSADTSEDGFLFQIMAMFRDNIMSRVSEILAKRWIFTTRKAERLGMGGVSIKTGDQVWILHGASTPVLLRPLENGNYEFLGAVYVHGIMGDGIEDEFGTQEVQRVQIE